MFAQSVVLGLLVGDAEVLLLFPLRSGANGGRPCLQSGEAVSLCTGTWPTRGQRQAWEAPTSPTTNLPEILLLHGLSSPDSYKTDSGKTQLSGESSPPSISARRGSLEHLVTEYFINQQTRRV